MEENKNTDIIDLRQIAKKILDNKRQFIKPLSITFVLSCIYIFSLPRYYTTDVKLAPELEYSGMNSSLGSLASSFGIDLSTAQTSDAITPLLYPDLMEDNGFVYKLFSIKVKNQEGDINTTYHDYLQKHQKKAWWSYPISWVKKIFSKPKDKGGVKDGYDPYYISQNEDGIYGMARNNIKLSIDKMTGVITINIKDQDPLVCRTLGDSIKDKLQIFITQYRTNKARIDYEYYQELTDSAKKEYEEVCRKYGAISDANTNITLKSMMQKIEDTANDMQIKLTTYTTLNSQLQAAKAKVQERTPAFTVIKGAAVPVKPAGPKRMLFVVGMLFIVTIGYSFWIVRSLLFGRVS